MREKKRILVHEYQAIIAVVFIGLLVIILLLMIKPVKVGNQISEEFEERGVEAGELITELEVLRREARITESALETCEQLNEEYVGQVQNERNGTLSCEQEIYARDALIQQLQSDYEFNVTRERNAVELIQHAYELNLSRIRAELIEEQEQALIDLESLTRDVERLERNYDNLSMNAANNICCKNKIDDPTIDSFSVINNQIFCGVGEKFTLSC